jgi:hypothetical protein
VREKGRKGSEGGLSPATPVYEEGSRTGSPWSGASIRKYAEPPNRHGWRAPYVWRMLVPSFRKYTPAWNMGIGARRNGDRLRFETA